MSEGGFESLLSSVLGNEELMQKISGIASAHSNNKDEALPEVIDAIASSMGSPSDKNEKEEMDKKKDRGRFDFSKSSRLLLALKPYLSEKRCHMIDSILRVEQIAEFMRVTR